MQLTEFTEAWKAAYKARTGMQYRPTQSDVEFIMRASRDGLMEGVNLLSFSEKAIDFLVSRGMVVTIRNALDRFNQIALHQKEVSPAHEKYDVEAYRKELEEIAGEPLKLPEGDGE